EMALSNILVRWLTTSVAIFFVPRLVTGVHVDSLAAALTTAAILGALNAVARPLLVVLTLPLTVVSLGLFLFVINAALLELAAQLVPGFRLNSFGSAVVGSMLISFLSWLLSLPSKRPRVVVQRWDPPRPPDRGEAIDLERDDDGKWH